MQAEELTKWYLYGLSANPPTKAHYAIIEQLHALNVDLTVFPSYDHPVKTNLIEFEHRVKMLNLLCKQFENVHVSTLEETLRPKSTYELIMHLRSIVPLINYTTFVIVCDFQIMVDILDFKRTHASSLLGASDIEFCVVLNGSNNLYDDINLILNHTNKLETVISFIYIKDIDNTIRSTNARQNVENIEQYVPSCIHSYILDNNIHFDITS
jgi:nicotinic acid mononucleotide adenylyltransferase